MKINKIVITVKIRDAVLDLKLDKKIDGKIKMRNPIRTCKKLYPSFIV